MKIDTETLKLKVRYYQDSTPSEIPCREENFSRREIQMTLPIEQTALILVDLWNSHFIESWMERASCIISEAISPAVEMTRKAGITVIHAPSQEIAQQLSKTPKSLDQSFSSTEETPWPPREFRSRQGKYSAYRGPRDQPPGIGIHWDSIRKNLSISSQIEIKDEDMIVGCGKELQNILARRKILHLIYAGFATNWCVLGKDYGIRALAKCGYNIVFLRDCTAGVEFPDTLDNLFVTEIAIREIEQQFGFTTSNQDYLKSCQKVSERTLL